MRTLEARCVRVTLKNHLIQMENKNKQMTLIVNTRNQNESTVRQFQLQQIFIEIRKKTDKKTVKLNYDATSFEEKHFIFFSLLKVININPNLNNVFDGQFVLD
jgi:hypothetical protein